MGESAPFLPAKTFPFNRGIYLLAAELRRDYRLRIGRLGRHLFPQGCYLYVGSAQRNLRQRLMRHLTRKSPGKKPYWHVDYLLAHARVNHVWGFDAPKEWECRLGRRLAGVSGLETPLKGFGSSDCHCNTHLYYMPGGESPAVSMTTLGALGPDGYPSFYYGNA